MFNSKDQAEHITQHSPSGVQVDRTDALGAAGKSRLPEPLSPQTENGPAELCKKVLFNRCGGAWLQSKCSGGSRV